MPRSSGFFLFVSLALICCALPGTPGPSVTAQSESRKAPSAPISSGAEMRSPEATADLSGQIIALPGGRPFRNVEVTLLNISSGATLRTHTDARGRYKFNGIVTGIDYVLTPWRPGYVFSPGALVVTHSEVAIGYDFTGLPEAIIRP